MRRDGAGATRGSHQTMTVTLIALFMEGGITLRKGGYDRFHLTYGQGAALREAGGGGGKRVYPLGG